MSVLSVLVLQFLLVLFLLSVVHVLLVIYLVLAVLVLLEFLKLLCCCRFCVSQAYLTPTKCQDRCKQINGEKSGNLAPNRQEQYKNIHILGSIRMFF